MNLPVFSVALALTLLLSAGQAAANSSDNTPSFGNVVSAEVSRIWNTGSSDLYVPVHTHHLRSAYDPELIAEFNENPWGIGYGRSYKDDQQGWHGLYAMTFKDSHSRPEPIAGYGRLYSMGRYLGINTGIGYTAGMTARRDIAHFVPVPIVLPLVSLEVGKLTLMTTFIPGGHNTGNIIFMFGKYSFSK